jgi:hypothetical protein
LITFWKTPLRNAFSQFYFKTFFPRFLEFLAIRLRARIKSDSFVNNIFPHNKQHSSTSARYFVKNYHFPFYQQQRACSE